MLYSISDVCRLVKRFTIDYLHACRYTRGMIDFGLTVEAEMTDTMSVTELAEYLGRKRRTVYEWVRGGYIQAVRDGLTPTSRMRVTREEAERVKRLLDRGLPL